MGHNIQMAYYLILTTHILAVSTYWIIWCQLDQSPYCKMYVIMNVVYFASQISRS